MMSSNFVETHSTVSSPPGWFLVLVSYGDTREDYSVWYDPVVAWEITKTIDKNDPDREPWFHTHAIGVETSGDEDCYILKGPDGILFNPYVGSYESEDDVINHVLEQRAIVAKTRAELAAKKKR